METYDSLDEIQEAYDRLVDLQEDLKEELFGVSDTDWNDVQKRIDEQNRIIESIESAEDLDERFQRERPEQFRERIETFENLYETISEEITERRDELEKELESVDQSMDLLEEYEQEGESSYHLDETI